MPSDLHERKSEDSVRGVVPVRQRRIEDDNWFSEGSLPNKISTGLTERNSFDKISLMLAGCILFVGTLLAIVVWLLHFDVQGAILITIALMSAVFTLLSVRESKRDREASVAPTLFIGKRDGGEYGILNLGNGPAHELTVKVAATKPDDWNDVEPEIGNKILCVDGFLPLGREEAPKSVRMTYRSNVGYKEYDVTRAVLLNDED